MGGGGDGRFCCKGSSNGDRAEDVGGVAGGSGLLWGPHYKVNILKCEM